MHMFPSLRGSPENRRSELKTEINCMATHNEKEELPTICPECTTHPRRLESYPPPVEEFADHPEVGQTKLRSDRPS